jgi:hypothetical protein
VNPDFMQFAPYSLLKFEDDNHFDGFSPVMRRRQEVMYVDTYVSASILSKSML